VRAFCCSTPSCSSADCGQSALTGVTADRSDMTAIVLALARRGEQHRRWHARVRLKAELEDRRTAAFRP
jgi:hypothetical protein